MPSFGTAGVRGIYPTEFNEQVVWDVLKRWEYESIFIGRDLRKSSPSLYHMAISAALSTGATVYALDVVPSPSVALATKLYRNEGAVITASHNPLNYNGLKLFSKGDVVRKEVANHIWNKELRYGTGTLIPFQETLERLHIKKIQDAFGPLSFRERILIHCNGATERLFPKLLDTVGIPFYTMNCRGIRADTEPSKEHLSHVSFEGLAFAPDGDGDRVAVLYKGEWISYDALAGWMAYHEVERLKRPVVAVNPATGLATLEFLKEKGVKVVFAKTGTTYVWEAMERHNAAIGTEPNGHIILRGLSALSDALAITYRFLQLWPLYSGELLELNRRSYYRYDGKWPADDRLKAKVKEIHLPIEGEVNTLDGIRIDGEDYWVLVRPSGTEHIIRYTVEAKDKATMEALKARVEGAIKSLQVEG